MFSVDFEGPGMGRYFRTFRGGSVGAARQHPLSAAVIGGYKASLVARSAFGEQKWLVYTSTAQ